MSRTQGSEFNVRSDPPRITSRRFIKTVKQKKRFRSSVSVCWVFAVKAMRETESVSGRGRTDAGCREVARLCLTLVTMGHFLGQARPVHVGLVPVS